MGATGDEDLFERASLLDPSLTPLAERMRPTRLTEVLGQQHVTGPGRFLERMSRSTGRIPSMILWGPPGSGKTTIARLFAQATQAHFETLSATSDGVRRVREVLKDARHRRTGEGRATVVFIDEIHRFNKGQQDALLADVERGVCALIGATTENPSFELNAALLSRARVVRLRPVGAEEMVPVLRRALDDDVVGLGARDLEASDEALRGLACACHGDVRRALNTLEVAGDLLEPGETQVTERLLAHALGARRLAHDKSGESHYNLASALIKSMRASDGDAAAYWLARLLEGGEDLMFVARRLVIFASEDVGNADPQALLVANAAADAAHRLGLPEAVLPLTQAVCYLALAPKSNAALRTYKAAKELAQRGGPLPVPAHLRNPVDAVSRANGAGDGYVYPHDHPEGVDVSGVACLPHGLEARGRGIATPGTRGWEADAARALRTRTERAIGEQEGGAKSPAGPAVGGTPADPRTCATGDSDDTEV